MRYEKMVKVANNILLSSQSIFNAAHGTAFVHNLMRKGDPSFERWLPRKTAYLVPHGTAIVGQYGQVRNAYINRQEQEYPPPNVVANVKQRNTLPGI